MLEAYKKMYTKLEDLPSKYITAKQVVNLKSLGIDTIYDLIYYFPRAYDNRSNVKNIGDLTFNEYVVIKASVMSVLNMPNRSGKKIVKAMITDGTGIMEVLWFGMPYISKSLKVGEEYIFIGQTKKSNLFQFINPEYKLYKGQEKETSEEILPIYSSNKSITQNSLRKIIKKFLTNFLKYFEENIPNDLIEGYRELLERAKAIKNIHFPESVQAIEAANLRFATEELLILELGILKNRFIVDSLNTKKYEIEGKKEKVRKFLELLPFELTRAQKKVIKEIYDEISDGKIVNRLVQGDVGSGKTAVATVMLIYMAENGYQGALMAPTEILANQHYLGMKERLEKIGLRVGLLTSSIKGKKKTELLEAIANGDIDIVIGTHSLIEDNVVFKKLGLIVIDEQHRFGVNQRNKLREKGFLGNLLVMTATPIPRSLALSIYGDLDLSIIDELPPGRTPIKTKWIANDKDLSIMYDFIYKKVNSGNQAYFVAPLIETSDKMALKSVDKVSEEIERRFSDKKIGIIHGKMKAKEKDEVMLKFKNKEYDILIATTVIEVGIDVPASTIMTIYNAERFGLSALHQLRGRVGRGSKQSYCFLISESTTENSKQRLSIMEKTEDGFVIAEEDLKLRNSGEIFGLRQSGFSDLKFIDIIYDSKTIKDVRDLCIAYLKKNKGKIKNEFLKYDIERKFSDLQSGN
ncbi:ATP-dependent DNA helicase RecG [Fusobacterium pseudoperiodonticum]|uniref:ATP-dependent DNA helicase RecG n=1 Tax=Fusobacterium pseudoperiodonticum TaxID=2663009 RepID=A0AAD0AQZ5_9FUSO|nr:ATP-dependent DNA helicase RecG [Fusobacterium pseudoperiodonticum]ATV66153.1 ATP-dependent DNA helicase RecG [Fusobacterium pseudoperiodonticum]